MNPQLRRLMRTLLFMATFAASCSPHPVDGRKAGESKVVETSAAAAKLPSSDQARLNAAAYSRGFSVEPLAGSGVPELRIWTEEYIYGSVTGFVARPGRLSIYEAYPGLGFRDGRESTGPVRRRTIATSVADDLIRMIPDLRRVWFGHCTPVLDGGGVIVEGRDAGGRFAFEIQNHEYCEGQNVDALNRALRLAANAMGRE